MTGEYGEDTWDDLLDAAGLDGAYDYSLTYADATWEDAFFAALSQNHFVDAATVEKWLIDRERTLLIERAAACAAGR